MCKLYGRWLPNYVTNCLAFLEADEADLDTGIAKPLQDRALKEGSQRKALAFLCHADVQSALEVCFVAAALSSLPVERKHAQAKTKSGIESVVCGQCIPERIAAPHAFRPP